MANNASDYLENKLLNHIFANNGGATYSAPATNAIYVSLHTGSPADDDSGANEITLGSYTRSNASNTLTWTVTGNSATNDQAIVFPQATANYDGAVTHIGIYDASTAGNLLFHGALTVSKTVTTGDTMQVNAGALTITME